jgi:hypothetical protein
MYNTSLFEKARVCYFLFDFLNNSVRVKVDGSKKTVALKGS